MIIRIIDGVVWKIVECDEADKIAQANKLMCAEQFVDKYNRKGIIILDSNGKVK